MALKSSTVYLALAGAGTAALIYVYVRSKQPPPTPTPKYFPIPYYSREAKAIAAADKEKFAAAYDRLVAGALHDSHLHPPVVQEWIRTAIDYNIPGGKNTRGLSVLQGVRCLNPGLLDDAETHFRVCVLGWCVEWLQGMFLVADDIMDKSSTRRGKLCWYNRAEVGMIAVNDALMLDALIYRLLKVYWGGSKCYTALMDLFHEVTYETTAGELCDLLTAPIGQVDLSKYSMEKYKHIVKYKTSLYSFYLPVAMAMLVSGVREEAQYSCARDICCHIGEYFQIQDDYLDCFGDPAVIGKVGTDIEDNKCSWLVCKALLVANPKQNERLVSNYGQPAPKNVAAVKELYKELKIEQLYKQYEEESFATMQQMIEQGASKQSKPIYTWLLQRLYKRTK